MLRRELGVDESVTARVRVEAQRREQEILTAAQITGRYGLMVSEVYEDGSMRLIGEGWAEGEWSVDQEHRASHIIADVLDRMRPETPSVPQARR